MGSEHAALRLSAYATAFFGILGTSFGLWLNSSAILLDGVFNWISFVMALVSIKVAAMIARPADDAFPFGYAGFEPMVNLVKSLLIIGVSGFALFMAITTILAGGRDLQAGWGVVYAVVAVSGCFSVSAYQRGVAKKTNSPLVEVDAKNWFINGAISSAVGLAFGGAAILRGGSLDAVVPYIDSGLVVLLVLLTIPVPIKIARTALGELLGYAPPEDLLREIHQRVNTITEGMPIEDIRLRATSVGRTVFLLLEARVANDLRADELDRYRSSICDRIRADHPHTVMDVVFRPPPGTGLSFGARK